MKPSAGDAVVAVAQSSGDMDSRATQDKQERVQANATGPPLQQSVPQQSAPQHGCCGRCLVRLTGVFHFFTFLPLIVINILQDINMVLASCICTGIALLLVAGGALLKRGGYMKVWPKKFDVFNVLLYGSMIPISILQHHWMLTWVNVYTNAGNAGFMWATILLPGDNFVLQTVRDRVPDALGSHRIIRRMALCIALVWASALTVMTVAAIIPRALQHHPTNMTVITIVCGYVLGFGPMAVAIIAQHIIAHIFRKQLRRELEQEAAAAAAAAAAEP